MDQTLIAIPLITSFVFWIIGISGTLRRTLVTILLSLAAMILAYQHFDAMAAVVRDIFGRNLTTNQSYALGFGVGLIGALILLYVLYAVLWKRNTYQSDYQPGGLRLVQSLFTTIIGWGLGTLLAACYLQLIMDPFPRYFSANSSVLWNLFRFTLNVITVLVRPWLVDAPPQFIQQLGL